jgi:pimeloyl-ACP methyl ester carboxylesterase
VSEHSERFTHPVLGGLLLHAVHRGRESLPPLVLLHGGGANAHWWDHLAPRLAERFHVVALDFRGHGDSESPERLEVGAFRRDLAALLDHLGASRAALVGHSMGAHVALGHAATAWNPGPGPRALVLVEPSRGGGARARRRARLALAARRTYATREQAVARFRFVPEASRADETLRRHVAEHSVRQESDRFAFKFDPRWFSLPPEAPPDLAGVRSPVLLVRGAESGLLTREGAQSLLGELPRAELREIPEAGHNVHLDQPEAFLAAVLDFLGAHS